MIKPKQVPTNNPIFLVPQENWKDMAVINTLDPLIIEVFRRYKVRQYFNKYYLVPISNEKMPISEEDAKIVDHIQHSMSIARQVRILAESTKYGK